MVVKNKLIKIEEIVKYMLINFPNTRDNDKLLYLYVCAYSGYDVNISLKEYCKDEIINYPSFDSVTRARRKLQEHNINLLGKTKKYRTYQKQEYEKYVKYT